MDYVLLAFKQATLAQAKDFLWFFCFSEFAVFPCFHLRFFFVLQINANMNIYLNET